VSNIADKDMAARPNAFDRAGDDPGQVLDAGEILYDGVENYRVVIGVGNTGKIRSLTMDYLRVVFEIRPRRDLFVEPIDGFPG
jgi:hypothetical protein